MDIPRTIGYTEIVKIAECALNGDSERARIFMKRYIGKYPDKDLVYPFTHLLNGVTNPSGLNSNIVTASDNNTCEHPKEKVIGWHDSSMLCTDCNSIIEQYGKKIDPPCKL